MTTQWMDELLFMMNWYQQEIAAAPAEVNPRFVVQFINDVRDLVARHSHQPCQEALAHPVQTHPPQMSEYQRQLADLHGRCLRLSQERDHVRDQANRETGQLRQALHAQKAAFVGEINQLRQALRSRERALLSREGDREKSLIDVTELGLHLAKAHNIRAGERDYIISQFLAKGVGPDTVRRLVSHLDFVRELSIQMAPRRSHRLKRRAEKPVQEEEETDSDEGLPLKEKEDLWSPESTSKQMG